MGRKLGTWNDDKFRFEVVEWIPRPGVPVSVARVPAREELDTRFVGTVPDSPYGVEFDPDDGITHNTAVFGILGSGKTTLAAELVWRTIARGAKVVVLDITNQWAAHFAELGARDRQSALEDRLIERVAARASERRTDEEHAGNVAEFRRAVKDELRVFIESSHPLLICNPSRLTVTQELGFLRQGAAEVLRSLTPAEIASCFAVALLEIVSDQERDEVHAALVLEEAHTLAPEFNAVVHEKEKQATTATARAILQGRKYGLGRVAGV